MLNTIPSSGSTDLYYNIITLKEVSFEFVWILKTVTPKMLKTSLTPVQKGIRWK